MTGEIREYFHACFVQNQTIYLILEKTQVKLFSNFTPFYPSRSCYGNEGVICYPCYHERKSCLNIIFDSKLISKKFSITITPRGTVNAVIF